MTTTTTTTTRRTTSYRVVTDDGRSRDSVTLDTVYAALLEASNALQPMLEIGARVQRVQSSELHAGIQARWLASLADGGHSVTVTIYRVKADQS